MAMNGSAFSGAMGHIEKSVADIKEKFPDDTKMQNCITVMKSTANEMNKIFDAKYRNHSN